MGDDLNEYDEQEKFISNLRAMQVHRDTIEKHTRELARYYRIAIKSLVSEGLTDHQALEIVKAQGPFLTWGNINP